MEFLEHYYKKNLTYKLINKFYYKKTINLPKITKVILNFGCKTTDIKELSASLLALELITQQKGKLATTNQPNVLLKIRKGNPVGCKVILRKKEMFKFLTKTIAEILPLLKSFNGFKLKTTGEIKKNAFSYELRETLNFPELEDNYDLFNNLNVLKITIVTRSKTIEELDFILKAFKLPIKN